MKRFKIASDVFKCLLLVGIMTACDHNEPINPATNSMTGTNEQNAKTNAVLKIVKYGNDNIQYVKNGKFTGMVSRVSNINKYTKYTYNDNNGTTNLFITSETYSQATNIKSGESIYEISNGRCVSVKKSNGATYDYKYNGSNQLEEVTMVYQGNWLKSTYTYLFDAASNAYRLYKVTAVNSSGPVQETKFDYTAIPEKYQLNPESIDTEVLLPFFGKFSDVLIKDIEVKSLSASKWTNFREYDYVLDNNGFVTSRTEVYHPLGKGNNTSISSSIVDITYSQYWQGI